MNHIDIARAQAAHELQRTLEHFCERHKPRGFIRKREVKEAVRRVVGQWQSHTLPVAPGLVDDAALQRAVVIELDRVLSERRGDWMDRAAITKGKQQ